MIALLTGWGLSRMWAWVVAVTLPVLLVVGAVLAIDAWGDARFRAGDEHRDRIWKAASDKLIADAAKSGDAATRAEVPRLVAQAARVQLEQERIDAAIQNGSSPVDALFPAAADNGVR